MTEQPAIEQWKRRIWDLILEASETQEIVNVHTVIQRSIDELDTDPELKLQVLTEIIQQVYEEEQGMPR